MCVRIKKKNFVPPSESERECTYDRLREKERNLLFIYEVNK